MTIIYDRVIERDERELVAALYEDFPRHCSFTTRLRYKRRFKERSELWASDKSLTIEDKEAAVEMLNTYIKNMNFPPDHLKLILILQKYLSGEELTPEEETIRQNGAPNRTT